MQRVKLLDLDSKHLVTVKVEHHGKLPEAVYWRGRFFFPTASPPDDVSTYYREGACYDASGQPD